MNHRPSGKAIVRGAALLLGSLAVAGAVRPRAEIQDGPIYEVRSYHIDPASLADYRGWIETHGLPYLRRELDVVGFWIDAGTEPEVRGGTLDPMGPANVTWIIRWPSKAERDAELPEILSTPEWQAIFARLPGGGAVYRRVESRFLDGL